MKKLLCWIGKHDFYVIKKFTGFHSMHIGCNRCHKEWGINFDVKAIIPWDIELAAMYRSFGFKNP